MVGWLLAARESEELAQELIPETCAKHQIRPGQLTLHADNGSAMIAKSVAQLLIDLDMVQSHSRPHVSDDNPYSEAQFKTLKFGSCVTQTDRGRRLTPNADPEGSIAVERILI